jgi:hypothetical protein
MPEPNPVVAARPGWIVFLVLVTLVHLALTIALLLSTFSHSMSHFDDGSPPGVGERVVLALLHVLSFPLLTPVMTMGADAGRWGGWALALANSLCWAMAACFVLDRLRRRR